MGDPLNLYQGARTLCLMPTYACPAQCDNCGTVSSPYDRNNISLATMFSAIEQAKKLDFRNVVFTGGEPTLRWDDLLAAIRFASELDLPTRVVTNAYWATDAEAAKARVRALINSGLKEINFSTGDEHVRFVPLDHVANAILAAVECGLTPAVMIELRAVRGVTKIGTRPSPDQEIVSNQWGQVQARGIPWTPIDPRTIGSYPEGTTVNSANLAAARRALRQRVANLCGAGERPDRSLLGVGMRITPEFERRPLRGRSFFGRCRPRSGKRSPEATRALQGPGETARLGGDEKTQKLNGKIFTLTNASRACASTKTRASLKSCASITPN